MAKLIIENQCCIDKSIIKAIIAYKNGSRIVFEGKNNEHHYDGCFVYGDLKLHNSIVKWFNSDNDTNLTIR